jgi:cytochrome c553
MRTQVLIVLGGLLLAGGVPVAADDPAAGRQVANMCRTCHGIDGYAQIPIAPHIGGEPKEYLESQLMAFKTGAREHEMMSVVAAWYAAHEVAATLPEGTSEADAPDSCVSCHGANGLSVALDAPNLAGEVNIYIDTQLKAFRLGRRQHAIMSQIAADMTDAEIRAVADWYSAIKLEIEAAEQ